MGSKRLGRAVAVGLHLSVASAFTIIVALGLVGQVVGDGDAPVARNIILMISDGCGYYHVDAASLYQRGQTGLQSYETFPVRLAMSTYPADGTEYDPTLAWSDFSYVDSGYTDSAAAATAMSTGVKTVTGSVGVDSTGATVIHAIERAEELGKSTGVVTTVPLSHATPAGFVVHNDSRHNYAEIAEEMLLTSAIDVVMGAGHPWFDNDGKLLSSPRSYRYVGGEQLWGQLTASAAGGDCDGDGLADAWHLVETRAEFQALATGPTPKRVVGVAQAHDTLQQRRTDSRGSYAYGESTPYQDDPPYFVPLNEGVPTLREMTMAALNVLDDDPDGLFLMVEGGAVDRASHANESGRMIEEQIDFNEAVEAAIDWVERNSNWTETLLVVTADHETGHLSGPGSDPTWEPLISNGAGKMPGMEWHSTKHTNSLVPLYARGSASRLLVGYADGQDPVRGSFLDNTELARLAFLCLDWQGSLGRAKSHWADTFDQAVLAGEWHWVRENDSDWDLTTRAGHLRLCTRPQTIYGTDPNDQQNLLLRPVPPGDFTLTTKVEFDPSHDFHQAGLIIYGDDDNFVLVHRGFCGLCDTGGDGVHFDSEFDGVPAHVASESHPSSGTCLRVDRVGSTYVAAYSVDGDCWTLLGQVDRPDLRRALVGLSAGNANTDPSVPSTCAEFDFVALNSAARILYLPTVLRS